MNEAESTIVPGLVSITMDIPTDLEVVPWDDSRESNGVQQLPLGRFCRHGSHGPELGPQVLKSDCSGLIAITVIPEPYSHRHLRGLGFLI